MTDALRTGKPATPWHLWLVGGLLALWNAFGSFDFTATATRFEPYMSSFPQEMRNYWSAFPLWMFALWGIAVWGGLAGSILLLLRRNLAVAMLGASLACAVITMAVGYARPAPEGASSPLLSLVIIAISALSFLYARWLSQRGLLHHP